MSAQSTLMLWAGAIAALCLAGPALADESWDIRGGAITLPALEYVSPSANEAPAERGKGDSKGKPAKRPVPPPSGCPFRQGDLELIA